MEELKEYFQKLYRKQTSENKNRFCKLQDFLFPYLCFHGFSRKNENRENTLLKILRLTKKVFVVLALRMFRVRLSQDKKKRNETILAGDVGFLIYTG